MSGHFPSTPVRRALGFAIVAVVASCRASTPGTPALAKTIGPSGGTLATRDGSSVEIPAGALASPTAITIQVLAPGALPGGGIPGLAGLELGPEGQTFLAPITITLAFEPAALPPMTQGSDLAVFTTPAGTMDHAYWLATHLADAHHVSAQTTHFSWVWIGDSRPFESQTAPPPTRCAIGGAACVDLEGEDGGFCSPCQCADGTECPGGDPSQCCGCSNGAPCPDNDPRLCARCDAAALSPTVPGVASQPLGPGCTLDSDLCFVCPSGNPVSCASGLCCAADHPACCSDGQSCGSSSDACVSADAGAPAVGDLDGETGE